MPDNWRFSEREIERDLRDLGARIEYPPTPDVSRTVRLKLDEEGQARRTRRWPHFVSPKWTAVAAALILISIFALTPVTRTTLSDLFISGQQSGSEAAKPAEPEGGGSEDRSKQEAGVASQAAGASAGMDAEGAIACLSPSIEALPARVAPGERFRLRGYNFSSGCDGVRIKPATGIRISFRQGGKAWKLATLDADKSLTFDTRLRVPAAEPGPAKVQATTLSGESVEKRLVILR